MKNGKNFVVVITSIIFAAFIGLSFLLYDRAESVTVQATAGTYAETFAKENSLEFVAIADSDNPNVEIPAKEGTEADEPQEEKNKTAPTVKDNGTFSYNYVDDETVTIVGYKGSDSFVTVPDTIDTLPVTKVAFDPIAAGVKTVQFSDNVTAIEGEYSTPRYTANFFAAMAVMLIGYAYSVLVTLFAFKKANSNEKTFYGIPVAYNGVVTFAVLTVASALFMLLNLSIIAITAITAVILVISAIGLVKTSVARSAVEATGEKVKQQTAFIRLLSADAEHLMTTAKTPEIKAETKKVYEAIRYSDPMSNEALRDIETKIQYQFSAFTNAVKNEDSELVASMATELVELIDARNKKCKALK